jgi:limonene-1,2-epoxide hydrolase
MERMVLARRRVDTGRMECGDLDVVREFLAAFNDRDGEATLAVVHPEISFQPLKVHGAEVWHGRDGVAELWRRMGEVGLDHTLDITELRVRSDGVVAAIGHVRPGEDGFVGLYRVEDGLISKARHYFADDDTRLRLGLD